MEKFKQVCVLKDANGEIVSVMELKMFTEQKVKELQEKAKERYKKECEMKNEQLEKEKVEHELLKKSRELKAILLAKQVFDDLVEKGTLETTEEFEEMFADFVFGSEIDLSLAPETFTSILERVNEYEKDN